METSTPPTVEPKGEELSIGAEVVERRTATSKHFYLGSRRYQARVSAAPIHYRDAEGTWQEIDTTLRPQAKGVYAVEANGLRAYLPAHSGGVVKVAGRVYPQAEPSPATLSTEEVGSKEEVAPLLPAVTRTLPPVDVSLSWEPVAWRYADAAGSLDDLAAVQPVDGQVEGDTITYEGILPQVNESYRVIPNGLKHQLTLLGPPRPPAGGLTGEITLNYVGTIELPAGLALYANGAVQAGDFTTDGAIEVRDGEGHPLLVLRAPVAYEAENPLETVGGSYAVWREGDRLRLAWRTPAAWLLATERRYPVMLDPTVGIMPSTEDSIMWAGAPDNNYGSLTEFYVGHTPTSGARRGLVRWSNLSAIPAYALIDDGSSDVRVWINQTGRAGADNNSRTVGLYRVTRSWTESGVTWNRYDGTNNWTTAGGDYDSTLLASTSVGTSSGDRLWSDLALRDVVALWRTSALLGYGEPNYGLLLKYTSETGDEVKWFESKENSGSLPPELDVDYTDGPRALTSQTPVQRRVPSPDYYSIPDEPFWKAVGIRASGSSADYDLRLYSDLNYSSYLDGSYYAAGNVDFVVIDEQASYTTRYPLAYSWDGTGSYQIEYLQRIAYFPDNINPGDSHGPYSMDTSSVIRLWTLWVAEGSENCVAVEPTSGDARLGVAVFARGTTDYYFDRGEALAQEVATTGGNRVELNYTAPSTSGVYGLVVWNESPGTTSSFYLEGCAAGAEAQHVFLPIILKNHWSCSALDNYEPNNSCDQAYGPLTSGQTYQSWISECDLVTYKKSDYFYIDISTTNYINVYLNNIPAGTDYDLYLYKDPGDDPNKPAAKSEGTGSSETIPNYAPLATGRYYIRVYGRSGSSTSPYSLRVTYD